MGGDREVIGGVRRGGEGDVSGDRMGGRGGQRWVETGEAIGGVRRGGEGEVGRDRMGGMGGDMEVIKEMGSDW